MHAHPPGIRPTAGEQAVNFGSTVFAGEYAEEARHRWGEADA